MVSVWELCYPAAHAPWLDRTMSTKEVPFCMAYLASSRILSLAATSAGAAAKVGKASAGLKKDQRCADGTPAMMFMLKGTTPVKQHV